MAVTCSSYYCGGYNSNFPISLTFLTFINWNFHLWRLILFLPFVCLFSCLCTSGWTYGHLFYSLIYTISIILYNCNLFCCWKCSNFIHWEFFHADFLCPLYLLSHLFIVVVWHFFTSFWPPQDAPGSSVCLCMYVCMHVCIYLYL